MKKILITLSVLLTAAVGMAQTPGTFNYQAVVRTSDGTIAQNANISLRFTIVQGSVNGTSVYVETHSVSTNAHGLANVQVGGGTVVSGTFNAIDWANGPYFIKVDMDINGGSAFTNMTTQELLAVPYALHANTVENSDNDESNELQTISKSGSTISLSDGGGDVVLADDDAGNELQTISRSGTDLTLSDGGGTVSVEDGDASDTNEIQILSKSSNNISLSNGGGQVSLNDDNATNELQTISKTGLTVTLSSGGGSFDVSDYDNDSTNEIQTIGLNASQLTLTNGGNVDLDDLNYWKAGNTGINYDNFVGIGTSTPQSELVVASDSVILTIGSAGMAFNSPNSGILRFREGVNASTSMCGFQFQYNGASNLFSLQSGCPDLDTVWTIDRTLGRMAFGSGVINTTAQYDFHGNSANMLQVNLGSSTDVGVLITGDRAIGSNSYYGVRHVVDVSSSVNNNNAIGVYNEIIGNSSSAVVGSYNIMENTNTGGAYGSFAVGSNSGTNNAFCAGGYFYGADYQTGTSASRYSYGVYGAAYANSATGTAIGYGVYASMSGAFDLGYAGYFNGSVFTTGSYLPSDMSLKQNIVPLASSLQKIMALNVYSYQYNTALFPGMNLPNGTQFGFIAQEMQSVFPELTTTAVQPPMTQEEIEYRESRGEEVPESATDAVEFTAVNYVGLIPHLTKAIQEQQVLIDQQAAQIGAQEEEIEALRAQLNALIVSLQSIQERLDQIESGE